MSSAPTYPVATIAKLLLISERRVQQLSAEGVFPKAQRGRYELVPVVQGYIRFLQERSIRSDAVPIDYHVEKARLTKAQADLAELQVARERADVVSVAQLEKNLGNLFAEVQTSVRNIPGRVVSALVGQTDERSIKRVLMTEIDQALARLADTDMLIESLPDAEAQAEQESEGGDI